MIKPTYKSLLVILCASLLMVVAAAASAHADTLEVEFSEDRGQRTIGAGVLALPARGSASSTLRYGDYRLSLEAQADPVRAATRAVRYEIVLSTKDARYKLRGSVELRYHKPRVVGRIRLAGKTFQVVLTRSPTRSQGCFVGS